MMSLKHDNFKFFWAVVTKKRLNSVYAKVSAYLSSGILNDKSAFSSVIYIFEKKRLIPLNSL